MTRRTPEVKHAKPEGDTGVRVWGVCNRERATGATRDTWRKPIGADCKRFLFSPDEEKKRREKEPKREEK